MQITLQISLGQGENLAKSPNDIAHDVMTAIGGDFEQDGISLQMFASSNPPPPPAPPQTETPGVVEPKPPRVIGG